jgi:hypothetical protein
MVWEILGVVPRHGRRSGSGIVLVALSALVVRCGGESQVRAPNGSAGQGPQAGGGAGKGGTGVGGSGTGASGGRGGFGGTGGTGVAGTGFGGMGMGGIMSAAGTGGAVMDPFAHCMVPPLVEGTACTFEDTCQALDCGMPWSLQHADGCMRTTCLGNGNCAAGELCVPAVVTGVFDDWLTAGCESCEYVAGECSCTCLEGNGTRAVCLDRQTFPMADECPIQGFNCLELDRATSAVQSYEESPDFAADVRALLAECRQKIADQWRTQCGTGGEAGAGGEGGGG